MHIFTDSSVDHKRNIGIGSYLFLENLDLANETNIKHIKFDSTSSTIAELFTIGYVFNYLNSIYKNPTKAPSIYLYTDCENFINLITIRKDTIKTTHRNYKLYKYLINTVQKFKINVTWTKGHMAKKSQTEKHQCIFSMVDKHARNILREAVNNEESEIE